MIQNLSYTLKDALFNLFYFLKSKKQNIIKTLEYIKIQISIKKINYISVIIAHNMLQIHLDLKFV